MQISRTKLATLLLLLASLGIAFGIAEAVLRAVLKSDLPIAQKLKKPQLYADYSYDDDYWKLLYRWQDRFRPPKEAHPTLGWIGDFDARTLRHNRYAEIAGRRPVLLYGDSCAATVREARSFQDILNNDPDFAGEHYLVNYGVGGYALDQIHLLLKSTISHFADPFVVFSLLTLDMDRAMLGVRVGQKPYYELVDGKLDLRGLPIEPNPERFYADNPPQIGSYAWRLFLHAKRHPPAPIAWLRGEGAKLRHKKALNRQLLVETRDQLLARDLDYVVMVFNPSNSWRDGADWRDVWLRETLDELGMPYIWAKDVVDRAMPGAALGELFVPANDHPTTPHNEALAAEIERHVLAAAARRKAAAEEETAAAQVAEAGSESPAP